MNIQIRDVPLYIYIYIFLILACNIVDRQTRVCNPVKLRVPFLPLKMTISSSTKISGYNLVGMFPKLAVDSDIFPNSSDMTLPGEILQGYISSSIFGEIPRL